MVYGVGVLISQAIEKMKPKVIDKVIDYVKDAVLEKGQQELSPDRDILFKVMSYSSLNYRRLPLTMAPGAKLIPTLARLAKEVIKNETKAELEKGLKMELEGSNLRNIVKPLEFRQNPINYMLSNACYYGYRIFNKDKFNFMQDVWLLEKACLYNASMSNTIQKAAGSRLLQEYLQENNIKPLSMHSNETRETVFVIGGPVSGKSALNAMQAIRFNDDCAQLTSTLYQEASLPATTLHPYVINHIVSKGIMEVWKEMAKAGKAPHLVTNLEHLKEEIDFSANNVEVSMATLDTKLAFQKAIENGIPTKDLLEKDKEQVSILTDFCKKGNVSLSVYDTEKSPPELYMCLSPENKTLYILDCDKAVKFFSKANLNINATDPKSLESEQKQSLAAMLQEINSDFTIKIAPKEITENGKIENIKGPIATLQIKDGQLKISDYEEADKDKINEMVKPIEDKIKEESQFTPQLAREQTAPARSTKR